MIYEKKGYSADQAVTAAAASTNVVDHQAAGDPVGSGLELVIQCSEAAAAAGAATVNFKFQTATDEAFTAPVDLWQSGAIGKAAITKDKIHFSVPLPKGLLRYSRVYYDVVTGPLTAGKFKAFLTPGGKPTNIKG